MSYGIITTKMKNLKILQLLQKLSNSTEILETSTLNLL